MKFLICLISVVALVGCKSEGGSAAGGSASSASTASVSTTVVDTANVYTFEFSGSGVTFSANLFGYVNPNHGGSQTETDIVGYTLGAPTLTQNITGKSMIANITLNSGAGTLTIVTKKNGTVLRTDTITTNATGISVNSAN